MSFLLKIIYLFENMFPFLRWGLQAVKPVRDHDHFGIGFIENGRNHVELWRISLSLSLSVSLSVAMQATVPGHVPYSLSKHDHDKDGIE